MRFEVKFTLTDDDFVEYNKFFLFKSTASRRNLMINRFLLPALMVVLFFMMRDQIQTTAAQIFFGVFCGLLAVLWLFFFRSILAFSMRRSIRRLKKAGRLVSDKEICYVFDDNGVTCKTAEGEAHADYSTYIHIGSGEHGTYLFHTANAADIVPARAFTDAAQRSVFVEFMQAKVAAR